MRSSSILIFSLSQSRLCFHKLLLNFGSLWENHKLPRALVWPHGCRHLPQHIDRTHHSLTSGVWEHELWQLTSCYAPETHWVPTFAASSRFPCMPHSFNEQSQMVAREFIRQQDLPFPYNLTEFFIKETLSLLFCTFL
jgi:hypothetical protein